MLFPSLKREPLTRAGPGAAEPLAGVAGRAREQQSPECACAHERGQAWFRAAKHPGKARVAPLRCASAANQVSEVFAARIPTAPAPSPAPTEPTYQITADSRAYLSQLRVAP